MRINFFRLAFLRTMAVSLLMLLSEQTNAQYYLNIIHSDGTLQRYAVPTIDSILVNKIMPEYVDLGLSVKWATFNIGAVAPEDAGYSFAWAETESKKTFDWTSYKYCFGADNKLTKYCTNSDYSYDNVVDSITTLAPEDDAAYVNWGKGWRTPTYEEFQELQQNCTWTLGSLNGVSGFYVNSDIEGYQGHFIFLPLFIQNMNTGSWDGRYWSSTLSNDSPTRGYFLNINNWGVNVSQNNRCNGYVIRPVCQ